MRRLYEWCIERGFDVISGYNNLLFNRLNDNDNLVRHNRIRFDRPYVLILK